MKQLWVAVGMAVFAVACSDTPAELSDGPAFGEGQAKAVLCHDTGTDGYVRIEIADPALLAHIDHGDAGPGELVPGNEEWQFTEACELEEVVVCPCWETTADISALAPAASPVQFISQTKTFSDGTVAFETSIRLDDYYGDSVRTHFYGGWGGKCFSDTSDPWQHNEVNGLSVQEVFSCREILLSYAQEQGLACWYQAQWSWDPWCDPLPAAPEP